MKYIPTHSKRILAIDPTTEGLAFAVIEDPPIQLIDWGIKNCGRRKAFALHAAEELIGRFRPDVLVLEDCDDRSRRCRRFQQLIQSLIELGSQQKLHIRTFSREEVRGTLGAETKDEAATIVARIFPELLPQLPRRREIYVGEDYRMAIFDVVTLAVVDIDALS